MGGFQKVTIIGTLSRDPETSYTPGGLGITTINVVTSYKKKEGGEEVASFHRIKSFGKQAEVVSQYFQKGKGIHCECELSYGQYDHKDYPVKIYTTDLILKQFSFLPGTGNQGSNNQPQANGYGQPQGGHQNQGGYSQGGRQQGYPNQDGGYGSAGGYPGNYSQPQQQQQGPQGGGGPGFTNLPGDDIPF